MARRKKYAYITDPALKASIVVETFVDKAKKEADAWARRYVSEIKDYAANEDKQVFAAAKLAGYYQGLMDPEVRNAIRNAIAKAKEKQAEVLPAIVEKAPTPAVRPEVKRTYEKVAEIIGAAAPAV